jgi:ubiquinone/menaquinone biosynthesis C-methylase UbiE
LSRPGRPESGPLRPCHMQQLMEPNTASQSDAREHHTASRVAHWDAIARETDRRSTWGGYYRRRLARVYRAFVAPGCRVLEVGSGLGDLLAGLGATEAVGVDFSSEMVERASRRHPEITFIRADAHALSEAVEGHFDLIILSDLVNDLWDVQAVLEQVAGLSTPRTRLVLNFYSRLWEPPLAVAGWMGLVNRTLRQNWLTVEDVIQLLQLTGFEPIRHHQEILWPLSTPVVAAVANRYLVKVWPFRWLALTNVLLARPRPRAVRSDGAPTVSVIVPARNEAGNIGAVFSRLPEMGGSTELIFVEGHSNDDTFAAIQLEIAGHPERRGLALQQTGIGKGDAVRLGFANASGDVLMILDADLTVPPEDLPRFYEALASRHGEFINGVRLVYPLEGESMRFFNFVANRLFGVAFSWLLGQPVRDTLCGTKVLWKSDYELIAANRAHFGEMDPFGDFDLLFGAARLGLKIVDLPIRYRARTYGTTNIQRWRHGILLLRMLLLAARRLKFW